MINFDNTTQKIRRSRPQPFYDYGVKDRNFDPFGSNASTGQGRTYAEGEITDPNQDTGDGDGEFAILINGAQPTQSGSIVIPASSFTIRCNSGDFTITRSGISAGGTSPNTLGPETLVLNTGFSADFPVGDGFKDFIVFGVVVFSKNSDGYVNAIVSNNGGTYNTKIYVTEAADSTPKFIEGFSDLKEEFPLYMFRIGTVRATKSGSLRRVYVTQIISGNLEVGDNLPTVDTDLFAFKVVDDGDGSVSVKNGSVNTKVATGLSPSGKPTELWLKVTFDENDGQVTGASVVTSTGTTSSTQDYRQIASITWGGQNNNTPTIIQGIKGNQSIASCGEVHEWGALYS